MRRVACKAGLSALSANLTSRSDIPKSTVTRGRNISLSAQPEGKSIQTRKRYVDRYSQ
jgi:hypothetical protein